MIASDLQSTMERVSRVITDHYGLRLVCEGDRCRTDGRTIYLPSLPEDVPDEPAGGDTGWADHECAHAIYTQTTLAPALTEKHGREMWTPAMQAGLASRRLSFRDVFTFVPELAVFVLVVIRLLRRCGRTESGRMVA